MFDALVNGRIDCGGANLRSRLLRHRRTEPPCRSRRSRRKQNQLRPVAGNTVPLYPAGQRFGFGTRQRTGLRRTAGNTSRFDPPGRGTGTAHYGQRPDEPPLPVDHAKRTGALLGNRTRRGTRGIQRRGVDPRRPLRLSKTGPGADRRLGRVVGIPHRIATPAGSHRRPTDTAGRASLRIERLLRTSIEYAFAHREESRTYIKEHARELDDRVIDHHIDFFVNSYSLSLGDEGRRAVRELTGVEV